jgi:hypothetical protein
VVLRELILIFSITPTLGPEIVSSWQFRLKELMENPPLSSGIMNKTTKSIMRIGGQARWKILDLEAKYRYYKIYNAGEFFFKYK